MAPSTVQETVTVTGEAPLIDLDLVERWAATSTAPDAGAAAQRPQLAGPDAARAGQPDQRGGDADPASRRADFQINMDGQQVTNSVAGPVRSQPRYSRDSIAEFEFVTNRFDATQGRSMGVIVNAVTKSGTNTPAGTFSGYFRDDSDWAARITSRTGVPLLESAVQRHVRRTDPARPGSLLRQLRIRARAADRRLQRPVPGVRMSTFRARGRRAPAA